MEMPDTADMEVDYEEMQNLPPNIQRLIASAIFHGLSSGMKLQAKTAQSTKQPLKTTVSKNPGQIQAPEVAEAQAHHL